MKLKNLLTLKIFFKKPVVILKILMRKQVFIMKCNFLQLDMTKTHMRHLHILGLWILMSKIPIKMIRIHGGQLSRQFMNLILENLNYLLMRLLRTVKIIEMIHKNSISPWKKMCMRRWL